jgi:glycosyltransferase involved in cell wall biosynthesis
MVAKRLHASGAWYDVAVKLALVSAKFPFGGKEPYLHAELRALAPYFDGITVFPTSPSERTRGFDDVAADVERLGLFSLGTAHDALAALLTRPGRSLGAVARLFIAPYGVKAKLKNVAVIPLGLALGHRLRRGGFEHVHAYWLSTPATVAYVAAQVAGIPWSATGHRWDIYENNALALKLRSARFVRAISARGRADMLAALGSRAGAARVEVVHVGVALPPSPVMAAAPAARPFALLCAANLFVTKGHRDLLDALAALRDRGVAVHCTIAGDGTLRDELHARAAELKLSNDVTFRGHVAHAALLDEIASGTYDAMILPSIELPGGLMEGIPVALMEAMARGLPVITTATGSITELVDDRCGRVVPQRSPELLADAVAELAADPTLRASLAAAGLAKIADEFDVLQLGATLAKLIRD